MTYWLEHRFIAHLHELDGPFVSPITKDLMTLTSTHRMITQAVLLVIPQDPKKQDPLKFGFEMGYPISRKTVSLKVGKRLTESTYASWVKALRLAGVFIFLREPGGNYIIEAGPALDCANYPNLGMCDVETHNPNWLDTSSETGRGRLQKRSRYSRNRSTHPLKGEEGAHISTRHKETKETEQVEINKILVEGTASLEGIHELASERSIDKLPPNYMKWLDIRRINRGLEEITNKEFAQAWVYFKQSGEDLPTDGPWTDGRENPLLLGI